MSATLTHPHVAPQAVQPVRRSTPYIILAVVGALSLIAAVPGVVAAQAVPVPKAHLEILLSSGRLMPTGNQNEVIQSAGMSTLQLSWVARPTFAITATGSWARSRDIGSIDQPRLDVFGYDLGVEVRSPRPIGRGTVTFRPFAGLGAGGRSYNYRHLDVDATHQVAGYGSAGGELGVPRVRLRLELRDYLSGFSPLQGSGAHATRNDLVMMVGLRLVKP